MAREGGGRHVVGWVALCAALTLAFALAQLPGSRLAGALAVRLSEASGAAVEVGDVGAGLGLGGPVLVARDLRLAWPGQAPLVVDELRVRPALSLAWLRGRPAFHVDASGPPGRFQGEVRAGAVDGELEAVRPEALPAGLWGGSPPPVSGPVSGSVDLAVDAGHPTGRLALTSQNGALQLAAAPVALPYQELVLEAVLPEAAPWQLEEFRCDGPLGHIGARGTVDGAGVALAAARLDLEVTLQGVQPLVRNALASYGVRVDATGSGRFRVAGTVARPVLR